MELGAERTETITKSLFKSSKCRVAARAGSLASSSPFLGMMAFINEGVTVESLFIENLYWCEYSLSISQTSLFSIEGFKFFLTHKK